MSVEDALNETKKNDDGLWQAAALESKAAALIQRKKYKCVAKTKLGEDVSDLNLVTMTPDDLQVDDHED